ncbi:unnamed protein product [Closterium sp. NIES-54]
MDAEMASWKSTGTYVDKVPPPGANIIWLRRPPGFTGSFPPGTQWSLRRPVYGLRQAPREWHDTLRTTLAALGFAPSTADPSLFLRTDTSLLMFYILAYVDDLVFATADTAGLAHVKSELQKRHTCTDLGELRSYLGLQITRDRAQRTITLTQSHMVQKVLQRFDFTYSSPQATPLSTRHSLSALPSDESVEPNGPYPELVGCLMYLMTCTRPDLAYPLSILARYVAPGRHRPEHMAAAKRVLRYLCSTSGMGLVLGGRRPVVLTGHADASWADDQATQRSSQGYTFSLGSGSVSWRSTRSSSVLSSSCEAEIYAGAMAAQELRWLTYLLTDLGEPPRSPPVLYVDNKAMLALCREHRQEHRTKHIALHYSLARELQQRGQLRLAYVASEANTADIFTKALPPDCVSKCLGFESQCVHFGHPSAGGCQRSSGDPQSILGKGYRLIVLGGYGRTDPLLNKPFYPNGLVVGILTWYQSGLGFESQCVHFGHPSVGGCERSTDEPRLILGKGYRHVGLGGYGRTDSLLNKPFYPNAAGATDLRATGATGSRATGTTGSRATGATVSRATGAAGFTAATPLHPPQTFPPPFPTTPVQTLAPLPQHPP